jgi:diguanylate cyclase (GGDEF)-like protein
VCAYPVADQPITLLIIEDDQDEAAHLRKMLEYSSIQNFEITNANSVDDALLMLRELPYDVVLLDLSNHEEGTDLDPLLRAAMAAADTPIVVIAGEWRKEDATRVLNAGAQEYLTKEECSERLLVRIISQAVERHRIQMELRAARVRDHYQATHDALTGLANRESFLHQIPAFIAYAERKQTGLALLFLDLDHFKFINDSLGHAAGDQLLKFVAERVAMITRKSDLVARFAGDEFVLCIQDVSSAQAPATVANNLLETLNEPYLLDGNEIWVTASIGVAIYPGDGRNAEELLRNSDMAMYRAKLNGRNNFQFCTESMNASAARRLLIRRGLATALERDQLSVEYQPIRAGSTGKVTAVEALLRWVDPEMGDVPPNEFIPIAEDSGLIVPIGEWVMREACRQARKWQDQGFRPIRISVNVSGRQLRQHTLVETVRDILDESRLSPACLEIEITEGTLVQSDGFTHRALDDLSRMGVGLVVDDFGTGYSALNYLRRFRFDRLKLDQSFVEGVGTEPDASAIAAAILAMAKGLKLQSLAEGVETEEQAAFLCAQGCDEMQGFLFGDPVSANELEKFLELEKPDE